MIKKPELVLRAREYEKALIREPRYVTEIHNLKTQIISGNQTILNEKFAGILAEIYLLSDAGISANSEYSIKIVADGVPLYNDSYANFATISDYETDIDIGSDASYYYAIFRNIAFVKSIYIEIYNSSATFDIIKLKIHREV